MKQILLLVAISLIVLGCSMPDKKNEQKTIEGIGGIGADSVPGKKNEYVITEEVFWVIQEEPENHFMKAKQKYMAKEPKVAAAEIRKAIVYMNLEIDKTSDEQRELLIPAKDKLTNIAERLEKGEKVKEKELNEAFYNSNIALYENYWREFNNIAVGDILDENKTDYYLEAAMGKIEANDKWAAKPMDKDTREVVNEGKSLSARFKKELKKDREAIKREWLIFVEKLKRLDEKLEGNSSN
jgi:hypothetical protein